MKTIVILLALMPSVVSAQKVPDIQLQSIDNTYYFLSELTGSKYTVIDFWATWCKPCINALPKLNDLSSQYKEDGINFIGINIDSPRNISKVRPFVHSLGISYPVLLDKEGEVKNEFNVIGIPSLFIINSEQEVVYYHEGYKPGDEQVIKSQIEKLLQNAD